LTGTVEARRLANMNETIGFLETGRQKLAAEGYKVFEAAFDAWLATNPRPSRTETGGPVVIPSRSINPRAPGDITKRSLSQEGTGAGEALPKGKTALGVRGVLAGTSVALTAFGDAVFGSHLHAGTFAADSIARQIGFFTKISYKEFVRLSWEAIFENGDVSDRNIDIFFNRILKAAKLIGVDDARLPQIAEATARFKDDLEEIDAIGRDFDTLFPGATKEQKESWQAQGKQQAIMAATGFYQIRVDRALGAQASSVDLFNPFGRAGRILNDVILGTATISLGGSLRDVIDIAYPREQYPWLWDQSWSEIPPELADVIKDWGDPAQSYLDLVALSFMAGRLMAENHGGIRHTNTVETNRIIRRFQTVVLASLATRGLVGALEHGIKAVDAQGVPFAELSKAATESMIAYYGMKSGFFEARNRGVTGGPNPNKLARANQMLVTALALRAALGE
jgi:hypothetical protein